MNLRKKINKNTKGFSIVEIIIYLSIFTALSIVVINSYIVVLSSFKETKTNRDLQESAATSIERISREIRQAKSIDVANSTLASSPGTLQLNSTDSDDNAVVIKFKLETTGIVNLYQGGVVTGNLLGKNIIATSLIFRRIGTTQGEAVKIEMTLQDKTSKNLTAANFEDTIILRGEY